MPKKPKITPITGYVLYEGPSLYTGDPIVVIITGLNQTSDNGKTGDMAQVWILLKDTHPMEAVRSRLDTAICGGCGFMMDKEGHRGCYVNIVIGGPGAVYRSYKDGKYPLASDLTLLGSNQVIRCGAYGDPAAVPLVIWEKLLANAAGWTGYTHGWRKRSDLMPYFQASVDNEKEFLTAAAKGWGTFRVRPDVEDIVFSSEEVCGASIEAGKVTTCKQCLKCNGKNHITTAAHGVGKKYVKRSLPILQEA